jgi:hypothetical protein
MASRQRLRGEIVALGVAVFSRRSSFLSKSDGARRGSAVARNWMSIMTNAEDSEPVVQLVTTKSDAEIAEDLKRRLFESIKPVLEIFDDAAAAGLAIQWESIAPQSPRYKHEVKGLRIVKYL